MHVECFEVCGFEPVINGMLCLMNVVCVFVDSFYVHGISSLHWRFHNTEP